MLDYKGTTQGYNTVILMTPNQPPKTGRHRPNYYALSGYVDWDSGVALRQSLAVLYV